MRRPSPLTLSPLERLAYLHTVPLFSRLEPSELLALAELCEERSFRRGAVLTGPERPVEHVHIIASGRVEIREGSVVLRRIEERDSLGLLSALARRTEPLLSVALTRVTTLALPTRALDDLLEDRFSILDSMLRGICRMIRDEELRLPRHPSRGPEPGDLEAVDLDDPVDRIIAMQQAMPFARDFPVALGQLARRVTPVRLASGEPLWKREAPAAGAYLLVRGRLWCDDGTREFQIRAPNTCGFVDALAESTRRYATTANGETAALRTDREALLDVFEDHHQLAAGSLAVVAGELIEVLERRANLAKDVPSGLLRQTTGGVPLRRGAHTLPGVKTEN